MERYGNSEKVTIIIVIFFLSVITPVYSQEYTVNVYDGDYEGFPKPIKTMFVDLEAKTLIGSITIADTGYLINKKPLEVRRGQSLYYISVVLQGCICKNGTVGQRITKIVVIDPETKQVVFDHDDSNLNLITIKQLDNYYVFVSGEINDPLRHKINGKYELGRSFELRLRTSFPPDSIPYLYRNLNSFRFYEPIVESLSLYSSTLADRRFIIKTDAQRNSLLDSLEIVNEPHRSIVFAAKDSLLYIFHQNYEYYGKFTQKTRQDDWIQSHLLIYNIADFSLIDSVAITDYPEGDYIIADFDVADIVGNYIVYYYAQSGGLEDYTPAMLFIFDTRTNEATWLRVGWR